MSYAYECIVEEEPMVSQKDIYISANEVIKKCGKRYSPMEYAYAKMTKLYDKGDTEGATVWAKIAVAVEELLDITPKDNLQ